MGNISHLTFRGLSVGLGYPGNCDIDLQFLRSPRIGNCCIYSSFLVACHWLLPQTLWVLGWTNTWSCFICFSVQRLPSYCSPIPNFPGFRWSFYCCRNQRCFKLNSGINAWMCIPLCYPAIPPLFINWLNSGGMLVIRYNTRWVPHS